jgi:hypothetical protein
MGRQPWTSRLTVEDCPIHLSTAALLQAGVLGRYAQRMTGEVSWSLSDGSSLGKLRFEATVTRRGDRALFIHRQTLGAVGRLQGVDEHTIRLATTRPHFGGDRFWFVCECKGRVGRLYLLNGEAVFRCRLCCGLTYQSSQEHNTCYARMRPILDMMHSCLRAPAQGHIRARKTSKRSIVPG